MWHLCILIIIIILTCTIVHVKNYTTNIVLCSICVANCSVTPEKWSPVSWISFIKIAHLVHRIHRWQMPYAPCQNKKVKEFPRTFKNHQIIFKESENIEFSTHNVNVLKKKHINIIIIFKCTWVHGISCLLCLNSRTFRQCFKYFCWHFNIPWIIQPISRCPSTRTKGMKSSKG